MKTLLPCHRVPFGLTKLTLGFSLGAGPKHIPAVVLWRNLPASDWAEQIVRCLEQKGKQNGHLVLREGKRKEERIFFSEISLWIPVVFMLKEANFSPSSHAKPWIFVETPHYHASISRALSFALTVCKYRAHPFILLWKVTHEGKGGRRLFDLEDECFDGSGFCKIFIGVENWKKKLFIQNSYCLDKNYGSVFRYCGKWCGFFFLAFFSGFIFPSFPLPFSKKKEEEINPENT